MIIIRRGTMERFLATDRRAREVVARMARSEVKNYLAEVAEEAGVPFGSPAQFIRHTITHAAAFIEMDPADFKRIADG